LASGEIAMAEHCLEFLFSFIRCLFSPVWVFQTKTEGNLPTCPVAAHYLSVEEVTFMHMISLL
jgi:hypothetical protein